MPFPLLPETKQTKNQKHLPKTQPRLTQPLGARVLLQKPLDKSGQGKATDPPDVQMWGHKKNAEGRTKMAPKEHPNSSSRLSTKRH